MRQYVQVAAWWPSLSCASTSTMYFHAFGRVRAKNFWFESMTCLCSNPVICRKRSASCFGALSFDRCLEMHLWNGSDLCICSKACNLSPVSSFGMASSVSVTLVISGVTVSVLGCGEVFCYVMLCSSTSGMQCGSINVGGSEHLNCGLPVMW